MTITALSIRQYLKSRSLLVVAIICLIPLAVAIIPHIGTVESSLRRVQSVIGSAIYQGMYLPLLLPITVLVLATAALGDEIDDKTLYLLALKPISRFRIVLEKFLAVLVVAVPVLWLSTIVVWAVAAWGRFDDLTFFLWPMLAGELVGIIGFGSVFLALSLVIRRTLLVGMFYVAIWEGALARFLPGIRNFSITHYASSMYSNLLEDDRLRISNAASTTTTIVTIGVVAVISLALATWRLRQMAID